MHKLLDRINYIKEKTKNMRQGFADSEEHFLGNLRQLAQNILKETYETERYSISGSIEQIGVRIAMLIPKLIIPNNTIADNIYQGVVQGESRRDFQKNHLDLAYNNISKKISHMNIHEIFEFLDKFSKKNLHNVILPKISGVKQIPVIVIAPIPKRTVVETRPVKC